MNIMSYWSKSIAYMDIGIVLSQIKVTSSYLRTLRPLRVVKKRTKLAEHLINVRYLIYVTRAESEVTIFFSCVA